MEWLERENTPQRVVRRVNGWSWPPSKHLIGVAVTVFVDAALFGAFLAPLLSESIRWTLLAIFSADWLIMVILGVVTITKDPIDRLVIEEESGSSDSNNDRDLLYCEECRSTVQLNSKHCWECKKCVSDFDHHCPYLNTCIGGANYWSFFPTTWACLVMLGLMVAVSVMLLVQLAREGELRLYGGSVHEGILYGLLGAVCAVNGLLCAVVSSLVAFHVYICCLRITTYEFIVGRRKQSAHRRKRRRMKEWRDRIRSRRQNRKEAIGEVVAREVQLSGSLGHGQQTPGQHFAGNPESEAPVEWSDDSADESSDSAGSSSEENPVDGGIGGTIFRRLAAQEKDLEVKKSISAAIFGSGVDHVDDPLEELQVRRSPGRRLDADEAAASSSDGARE